MYHKSKNNKTLITHNEDNSLDVMDVQEIIKISKRHFRKGEFFMVTFELINILRDPKLDLKQVEMKVLLALLSRMKYNNQIEYFVQSEIAKEINSTQASVSRSLKKFIDNNLIIKDKHNYYFNDDYLKGAGDNK